MTRIGVLTTGRQDWGILRSTCWGLRDDPQFDLVLFAGGMHASAYFGRTLVDLEAEGCPPAEVMPWIDDHGQPGALGQAAAAVQLVGEALARQQPDALLLVGDRFETAAAALAATLAQVPLVHLHGGEETEGAIDNSLRHAITKLSHLHFVSHREHRDRVAAMGEDPAAIHVVGAPGLDNMHRTDLAGREELEHFLGVALEPPVVLVTVHPTTLSADPIADARAVFEAIDDVPATYVITMPNADPGNGGIVELARRSAGAPRRAVASSLGERRYWGLMRCADAMLGNSSSAIIEAPVLSLPAVNVGVRQRGRLRGGNVLDCEPTRDSVAEALRRALLPRTRQAIDSRLCQFGDGHAARRILDVLREWTPPRPPVKRFHAGQG